MSYDADYPKKPMGGGNPYYACAYCGITDPLVLVGEDGYKLEGFWAKDMLSSVIYEYEN